MMLLTESEISVALQNLPSWVYKKDALFKTFVFKDFKTVMTVMVSIAFKAEEMNHHPDWSNVYNTLNILLSTHDAGGVTQRDIDLAIEVEKITSKYLS